jgi:predicted ATP-grasp superfamily ATP-dependent carboligase
MALTVLVHEWVTGGGLADTTLPGSWAAEGNAMRRAIANDFAQVEGVSVLMTLDARIPAEPGPWSIVPIGPGEEADRFAELAAHANYTVLIAPETGGILAARAQTLERAGGRSLGSAPSAIEIAGDKIRLGAFLDARAIRTPECRPVAPKKRLPEDFPYPAVLKPIDGAGSLDTFFIEQSGSLPLEAQAMPMALLQRFVSGVPMSASYLVGRSGAHLVGVGRQRMEVTKERFRYRGGVLPADRGGFDSAVQDAVDSVPGLAGFVGVDFVWDEEARRSSILEINPRPTTSCAALTRLLPAGMLARAWIDIVEGGSARIAEEVAAIVQSQAPLTFHADGTVSQTPTESSAPELPDDAIPGPRV